MGRATILVLLSATVLGGTAWPAAARADFFDDVRRTFQRDIPRTFEHDIPRAFGAESRPAQSRPAPAPRQQAAPRRNGADQPRSPQRQPGTR